MAVIGRGRGRDLWLEVEDRPPDGWDPWDSERKKKKRRKGRGGWWAAGGLRGSRACEAGEGEGSWAGPASLSTFFLKQNFFFSENCYSF